MPKTRLERALDKARAAIDAGDYDDAEAQLAELAKIESPSADVAFLQGELASAKGEAEKAVERFLRAAELDPEWPDPLLAAADEALEGLGSPDRALEIAERVIEDENAPDDAQAEALLIAAAALIDGDDPDDARARLEAVEDLDPEDPEQRHALAELWLELDPARAEAVYQDLLDEDPEDTDALHGLGFCRRERGATKEAADAWLEVRRRDLAEEPELELDPDELEAIAERTLKELPDEVRDRLGNVPILVEDAPSEELVREGVDPRILGLFTGTPLPEKSALEGQPAAPDAAILYLRNLAAVCQDEDELAEQVRITILHETAHFFGLEDEDLEKIGLG